MKWLLGALGCVLVSGCGTFVPRCETGTGDITNAQDITNTPCVARLPKGGGKDGTYVIVYGAFGYTGEELP